MTNYKKIKSAIQNKQKIIATYKEESFVGCPHVLGNTTNVLGNNYKEVCVLFCKGCLAGYKDYWTCLPIEELKEVEIIERDLNCSFLLPKLSTHFDEIDYMVDFNVDL